MKICYFGTFDKNCLRNRVIIEGLKRNSIEVVYCHTSYSHVLWVYLKLFFKWLFLAEKKPSAIIIGETGYIITPLAKFIGIIWNKPVILDAYFSMFQTEVFDRLTTNPGSYEAWKLLFVEKIGCRLADLILLDTNAQINYFCKNIYNKPSGYMRVFAGSDDKVFHPQAGSVNGKFKVLFWGNYIPLHGIEHIVRAAKMLEQEKEIIFEFIGKGQTYHDIVQLTEQLNTGNVAFLDYIDEKQLVNKIAEADICLGIFGDSSKAVNVIPNKVFQAIALCKPLITARTPATQEIFIDKESVMFCEPANPGSLAEKILELNGNPQLCEKIAKNAYKLFKEKFTPEKVTRELIGWINEQHN
ncbi:MAG: glycosyltransferase [Elusimicrobia bacterium]|nr:glycosyltransferase [Elusimicrobiota bacterium]MBU2614784.1 glycosyltransferase [Elusimicrobiota bacterium]